MPFLFGSGQICFGADSEELKSQNTFMESFFFPKNQLRSSHIFTWISFVYDFPPSPSGRAMKNSKWKEEDIKSDRQKAEVESRKLIEEFHRAQESENERAKKEIVE